MRITISPHLSGLVVALAFATTLSMAGMVSASADVSPVATDQQLRLVGLIQVRRPIRHNPSRRRHRLSQLIRQLPHANS